MKRIIYLLLMSCLILVACQDDDDQGNVDSGKVAMRIKRVVGENAIWGKYELIFHYRADGRLDNAWCLDRNKEHVIPDTIGSFTVDYDVNYHDFRVNDHVLNIDDDSVRRLQQQYPDSYEDTLRYRRIPRARYTTLWEDGHFKIQKNRPRMTTGSGNFFNNNYINVSSQTHIPEYNANGQLLVSRCFNDVYMNGAANSEYTRTVTKYEFVYNGKEIVSGALYKPDSFNDASWSKLEDFAMSNYAGILVGVDNEGYKMRRGSNKVVVAEPGKNTTYTLNSQGLAVKVETTDGETATIEYENGYGNFAELYATPVDRCLGKIWVQ